MCGAVRLKRGRQPTGLGSRANTPNGWLIGAFSRFRMALRVVSRTNDAAIGNQGVPLPVRAQPLAGDISWTLGGVVVAAHIGALLAGRWKLSSSSGRFRPSM